jgi:hypothetical protein
MEKARTRWFNTSPRGSARVARQRLQHDLRQAPRAQAQPPAPRQSVVHPAPAESSTSQADLLHTLLAREVGA